jgi:hypothetical protein
MNTGYEYRFEVCRVILLTLKSWLGRYDQQPSVKQGQRHDSFGTGWFAPPENVSADFEGIPK